MSVDDLEVGKCPFCGGDMYEDEEANYICEECGYAE